MSWDLIFQHLFIVLAASLLSIAVGLPLGIWAYVSKTARPVILRIVDLLQTIPSLALLGIIMVVLDPGKLTVITGITLYSLLPIVRNTCLGLQEVDPGVKEAARGMGMSKPYRVLMVEFPLAFPTVVQMVPFMILVPFLMVIVGGGGVKALKGMVGITLVSGVSFVVPQLIVAKFTGPELAVIVGCVVSLGCTILMARARKGKAVPAEYNMSADTANAPAIDGHKALVSWLPFILIFVLLLVTSKLVPPVNNALAVFSSSVKISTSANAGNASFSWINTPGIWIFVAAIIGGFVQKATPKLMIDTLVATVKQMSKTIITIMSVLAVAKIMTYCGMINDMAVFFVSITGHFYPFVAPIIAALGAFITGSGTSTEVLLGSLQTAAAEQIGASQFWLAAANSTGAGIGKILSPQCIATAAAAVGLVGQDSKLLGGIIKWAVLELVIACLLVGLLGGIVPPILGV